MSCMDDKDLMKLIDFKKHFFDVLFNNYDSGELNTIFYLFIDHFLNVSKIFRIVMNVIWIIIWNTFKFSEHFE